MESSNYINQENLIHDLLNDNDFRSRYPTLTSALLSHSSNTQEKQDSFPVASTSSLEAQGFSLQKQNIKNNNNNDNNTSAQFTEVSLSSVKPINETQGNETQGNETNPSTYDQPLQGLTKEQTPTYFLHRLDEIQKSYLGVSQKRHAIQHFHNTMKALRQTKESFLSQRLPSIRWRSRLERYNEVQCPSYYLEPPSNTWNSSSSYISAEPQFTQTMPCQSSLQFILNSRNLYNKQPDNEDAAAAPLINPELVVHGLQKMPKLNPAIVFHKDGCDMILQQLQENGLLIQFRNAEVARKLQHYHFKKEHEGLNKSGANKILSDLLFTQRELLSEQQRQKEEILENVLLEASEIGNSTRKARNEYYKELYSPRENIQVLSQLREQAKNISTIAHGTDVVDKNIDLTKRRYSTCSKNAIDYTSLHTDKKKMFLHEDKMKKQISRASPADIEQAIKNAKYKKKPVEVPGYHNLKSHFPGVYPQSTYRHNLQYGRSRYKLLEEKRRWEHQGEPIFKEIILSEPKQEKTTQSAMQLSSEHLFHIKKQFERRELEELWDDYLKDQQQSQVQKRRYVSEGNTKLKTEQQHISQQPLKTQTSKLINKDSQVKSSTVKETTPFASTSAPFKSMTSATMLYEDKLSSYSTPKSIQIVIKKPTESKKAELDKGRLIQHLPRRYCRDFVDLNLYAELKPTSDLQRLHIELKKSVQLGRLGLPSLAQPLLNFARLCQEQQLATDIVSDRTQDISPSLDSVQFCFTDYALLLTQCLPYYPLQLDLLDIGIAALILIYNVVSLSEKADLSTSYVDCFTALLAVDDSAMKRQLIFALSSVLEFSKSVTLSTAVVDYLLEALMLFSNPEETANALKILALASLGHRKADQYSIFIGCLTNWKDNVAVIISALFAIDSFALRAQTEVAYHRRQNIITSSPARLSHFSKSRPPRDFASDFQGVQQFDVHKLTLHPEFNINPKPPAWMPQDGSDIQAIFQAVELHYEHRKLMGTVCAALASLCKTSLLHAKSIEKLGWRFLIKTIDLHQDSISIATNTAVIVEYLVLYEIECGFMNSTIELLVNLMTYKHTGNPEITAACCAALVAIGDKLATSIDIFTKPEVLRNLTQTLTHHINEANNALMKSGSSLIAVLATSRQIVNMPKLLTQYNCVSIMIEIIKTYKTDVQVIAASSRGLARLVYKNVDAEEHFQKHPTFLVVLTTLLVKYDENLSLCYILINTLRCCVSAAPFLRSLFETGHLEILKKIFDSAKEQNDIALQNEIKRLLKELQNVSSKYDTSGNLSQDVQIMIKKVITQLTH